VGSVVGFVVEGAQVERREYRSEVCGQGVHACTPFHIGSGPRRRNYLYFFIFGLWNT